MKNMINLLTKRLQLVQKEDDNCHCTFEFVLLLLDDKLLDILDGLRRVSSFDMISKDYRSYSGHKKCYGTITYQ